MPMLCNGTDKTDKTVAELVVPNSGGSSPLFRFVEELLQVPHAWS